MATHLLAPSHLDGTVRAIGAGWRGDCAACLFTTGDTASFRGARTLEQTDALAALREHVAAEHGIDRVNVRVTP